MMGKREIGSKRNPIGGEEEETEIASL